MLRQGEPRHGETSGACSNKTRLSVHMFCVVDACVVYMATWFAQCTYVCLGVVVDARAVCMKVANAHVV